MAAIEVDAIVLDSLQKSYSEKFGRSPSHLVTALNLEFSKELDILKARKNTSSQRDLISDKTLRNFFSASPPVKMQERSLNYLCKLLLGYNSYQEAKGKLEGDYQGEGELRQNNTPVSIPIQKWLSSYQMRIQELCGTIRILDMKQPVNLQDVYADVLVYEGVRRQQGRKLNELLAELDTNPSARGLDKYLFADEDANKRISGLEAVQGYQRLILLGRPGAGKTTLCKYLAMYYTFEQKGEELIPIYISLKDFSEDKESPSLTIKVANEFKDSLDDSEGITRTWLQQGRFLLLLDGLDEVALNNSDSIFRLIRDFIRHYPTNHFVITCRTAARDQANFDRFTIVELASFSKEQIQQFVTGWFHAKPRDFSKANTEEYIRRFLTKLSETPAVSDLATNPLMLTMLCCLFEDSYNFPRNKHSLYGDTVDALLRRWDATRRIERYESYGEKLSRPRKMNLFSQIAYEAFSETPKKRLWQVWELEKQIRGFIENISGFTDLDFDSHQILKEIEVNHGLLVEQYTGIYSFSHLTFQEFFTARYILDAPDSLSLLEQVIDTHATDPGWREVFLIIAGRLSNLDQFLKWMFAKQLQLMQTKTLQEMLHWLWQTTVKCDVASSAWRAFFLAIDLDTALYIDRNTSANRTHANRFATALRNYNVQEKKLIMKTTRASLTLGLVAIHALADLACKSPNDFVAQNIDVKGDTDELKNKFDKAIEFAHQLDLVDLELALQELKKCYPKTDISSPGWQDWAEDLRQVMIKHLQVGYEKQLTDEETQALDSYLYVGDLIMECIQGDSYVSKGLRESIIDSFLLPDEKIPQELRL